MSRVTGANFKTVWNGKNYHKRDQTIEGEWKTL